MKLRNQRGQAYLFAFRSLHHNFLRPSGRLFSWTTKRLIQYVNSMGFTPNRLMGLLYGIGGGILVVGFLVWALRKPQEPGNA